MTQIWERGLGGPLGERVRSLGVWANPRPWVLGIATLNFLILILRQIPCLIDPAAQYRSRCYTDITPLFYARQLSTGGLPFITTDVEYPVLTGTFMLVTRWLVNLFGGVTTPEATAVEQGQAAAFFFGISIVLLFALFLAFVWAHLQLSRPWDALLIAAAPAVFTCGLINWDMLPLALTAGALLAWSRRQPFLAGIWLGLGIAAKLYPILLLVPLAVLCLRAGKLRAYFWTLAGTGIAWVGSNLPIFLAAPKGWLNFWTFNADRGADWGSVWLMLSKWGITVPNLSLQVAIWMVLGTTAICLLALVAPRRPRLAQIALLLLVLFLIVNKVYSPQYVLWLLPFVVLALPNWRIWLLFAVTEYVYFLAIWAEIGKSLTPESGLAFVYPAAIAVRILGQVVVAGFVVRDLIFPEYDVVRVGDLDDPDGGVLDQAPDWFSWPKLRRAPVVATS